MRRWGISVAVAVAALLLSSACGDDGGAVAADDDASGTGLTAEEVAFCDEWTAAMTSGDEAAFDAALADSPPDLEQAAGLVLGADAEESASPEVAAAADEILNWIELHCFGGDAAVVERHIAPPLTAELQGLTFCGTTSLPSGSEEESDGMVLYGETSSEDPYAGPMLGLLWNPAVDGTHEGDGEASPVTVRGLDGFAAPITVFQQTVLPELGTVIAWTEGDVAFGLYGRHWTLDSAAELVAIADRLEQADDGFRIPADALPPGYGEVFTGQPSAAGLVFGPAPSYSSQYQAEEGVLSVTGLPMTDAEFEAFRFFTLSIEHERLDARDALVGNAWHSDAGPAVVTWHEPDGLVVRIVGIGVPLDTARQVAAASRELSPEEWAELVETDSHCFDPPGS